MDVPVPRTVILGSTSGHAPGAGKLEGEICTLLVVMGSQGACLAESMLRQNPFLDLFESIRVSGAGKILLAYLFTSYFPEASVMSLGDACEV